MMYTVKFIMFNCTQFKLFLIISIDRYYSISTQHIVNLIKTNYGVKQINSIKRIKFDSNLIYYLLTISAH